MEGGKEREEEGGRAGKSKIKQNKTKIPLERGMLHGGREGKKEGGRMYPTPHMTCCMEGERARKGEDESWYKKK
jgi:hypothetical protein